MRHLARPEGMPPAHGYSHAVVASGALVAVSGQVPLDAAGDVVGGDGDVTAQLRQVFRNIGIALAAAGAEWRHVIKLTVYLVDIEDRMAFRAVRDEFVDVQRPPASSLVQVSGLVHPAFRVEVDALAVVEGEGEV